MSIDPQGPQSPEVPPAQRLFVYTGGMARGRIRRILTLAGYQVRLGWPRRDDSIAVWGRSPLAARGEAVAKRSGAALIRIEDPFLRSIRPGRMGEPPLGLLIDDQGVHFDGSTPSRLERLLATHPLDDSALLSRARDGIARLIAADLSKYNLHDFALSVPKPGYVLVVDQVKGDASIRHSAASATSFLEMLVFAQEEHPSAPIVVKTHPETAQGLRHGHYGPDIATGRITLLTDPVSPWKLMEGAIAVYTVSSQLGFEAVLLGHCPRVFGQPFYAGWGLTEDQNPVARRRRKLTRNQLFAGAMLLYPAWYDPCRDALCRFETALDQMEASIRAYREDRRGHVAVGMRLWKRQSLQQVFGREKRLIFCNDSEKAKVQAAEQGRDLLVWAGREEPALLRGEGKLRRVEDGFLRSRGLGAALVPPLSLVTDDLGIYYDPTRESRLERLISTSPVAGAERRAERLLAHIGKARLSKYNLPPAPLPLLPEGRRILVPGQVEDDASIRLGTDVVATNLALLRATRADNPEAIILYKPHPDVEAGLRPGAIAKAEAEQFADLVLPRSDPIALIEACDEVWTMTSLLGFEALIRGRKVTCLGAPFYAGWGLTRDLGRTPARRGARPTLLALAHAVLIAYPRYRDPVTGLPCPAEVIVDRLASNRLALPGPANRVLSKLQGLFASQAHWWR